MEPINPNNSEEVSDHSGKQGDEKKNQLEKELISYFENEEVKFSPKSKVDILSAETLLELGNQKCEEISNKIPDVKHFTSAKFNIKSIYNENIN